MKNTNFNITTSIKKGGITSIIIEDWISHRLHFRKGH